MPHHLSETIEFHENHQQNSQQKSRKLSTGLVPLTLFPEQVFRFQFHRKCTAVLWVESVEC